jgi:hypothetical protein
MSGWATAESAGSYRRVPPLLAIPHLLTPKKDGLGDAHCNVTPRGSTRHSTGPSHQCSMRSFRPHLWSTQPKPTGVPMKSDVYKRALHPFTWGEFASYLAVKAKNTAPGKSGVRYAHLHFAPEHIQRSTSLLLNAAFWRQIAFDSWRDELIYRTEKVPGDPDQMNKHPLELQNVLRKLCGLVC